MKFKEGTDRLMCIYVRNTRVKLPITTTMWMGGGGDIMAPWWVPGGLLVRAAQYCKDVAVDSVVAGLFFSPGRRHTGL